ncbi:MAG: hypothetical protein BM556_09415 [Bacteriovorax sp. MedPE-SWde]|nr:MAG: hypothetical protein BM556_09415 [Bacteriovorax sp. MedPE-SWde]
MRAIFLREDSKPSVEQVITLSDDRATHLIKATRVRKADNVLILDGEGRSYTSEVLSVSRRDIDLKIISIEEKTKTHHIDLCLGLPKKDAFELAVKNSVELGVRNIYPFVAQYTQWAIKNPDRVNSLIESALIQSNNYFFTTFHKVEESLSDLQEMIVSYDVVVLTTLKPGKNLNDFAVDKSKKYLIIIGPEGGLSDEEEDLILSLDNTKALMLDTPILRTPNAVSSIIGYLHGKFAAL